MSRVSLHGRWTRWLGLACLLAAGSACGTGPEQHLVGRWKEADWAYEKLDAPSHSLKRSEGIRVEAFEGRDVAWHEAEYWELKPDRTFEIALDNGTLRRGRWRLKGRGHILTLRYDDGAVEVYDVKELDRTQLIVHFDLGMEVRGIARLTFEREVEAKKGPDGPA